MIIPVFKVVVSQYPIAATTTMEAGTPVGLSSGKVVKCSNVMKCAGLAADRNRAAESYEWVNRVSDMGQDVRASGMMSVYHSGGEFYLDVNDSTIQTPNGTTIAGVVTDGSLTSGRVLIVGATAGLLESAVYNTAAAVALILEDAAPLDSGIPGEYEPGSSVNYATDYSDIDSTNARKFVKVKLLV